VEKTVAIIMQTSALMLGLIILMSANVTSAFAQERIRIATAGGLSIVPVWVMHDKGLLKKRGVTAEIVQIASSPVAIQAMLSGEVEAIVTSAATLVTSRLAGADVTMIMSTTPTFPSVLMAVKTITDINQLRGRAGGVNRFGSNTDFGLRMVLRQNAIDPEKDVKLIQVGGTAQMVAAISRGLIQFALFNEPFVRDAEKLGFKTLVDVPSQKIPFHWNGVLTSESALKARRGVFYRLTMALTEAIHVYKTEKEWSKALIGRYLKVDDPESLERAYNSLKMILPETPAPTPDGVKTLLDDLSAKNPKAAAANPKDFVDMSFVEELERSGFIKQLYGRSMNSR
jgi:ABC-type nitrate/sulfonate/bicarbonate transport system substrate-binding protein